MYKTKSSDQIAESDQTFNTIVKIKNLFDNKISPDIWQLLLLKRAITTESSIYVFGESGTGKTTGLQMAIKVLENEGKKVLFISNDSESGTTLDSVFNLPNEEIYFSYPITLTSDQQQTLNEIDVFVVDDIDRIEFDRFYTCYQYSLYYTNPLKPQSRWIVAGVFDRDAHYFKMFLNVELKKQYMEGHNGS